MLSLTFKESFFKCSCGHVHQIETREIVFKRKAIKKLPDIIRSINNKLPIFLVGFDDVLVPMQQVKNILVEHQFQVVEKILPANTRPDMETVNKLVDLGHEVGLFVSIGSGSVTDMVRLASHQLNLPFISVATAPSMDGYLSTNSPVYRNGFKQTVQASAPYAVVIDLDILEKAPNHLIAAGAGDILGKYTANFDWYLSHLITGETYCEVISKEVLKSADECLEGLKILSTDRKKAIRKITKSLLLSSLGMQLLHTSRCASGGEHAMAHTMEMYLKNKQIPYKLHGESVYVASMYLIKQYQAFLNTTIKQVKNTPDYQGIKHLIQTHLGLDIKPDEPSLDTIQQYLDLLNQNKKSILQKWNQYTKDVQEWEDLIKKLYPNEGKWIDTYLTQSELKLTAYLASTVRSKFTLLYLINHVGYQVNEYN